jgi:hypothetical protein
VVAASLSRSPRLARSGATAILCLVAAAVALTLTARTPAAANDSSRWCTVWSLLEQRTYVIDICPWETVDKVYVARPAPLGDGHSHFLSSKPALLSTLVAGILYPVRALSGIPLSPRGYSLSDHAAVQLVYFKLPLLLLNVLPFALFLRLYGRLLDLHDIGEWAWAFCFLAAAVGNQLFAFNQVLNNHTVAAYAAFFALYALTAIERHGAPRPWTYAACGFLAAFAACCELPALVLLALVAVLLARRSPATFLRAFLPAALLPLAGFVLCQRAAFGQVLPVYLKFGTGAYGYAGSYWNHPGDLDRLNVEPEPRIVYLLNMTVGHHGVFSLTPIFILAMVGLARALRSAPRPSLAAVVTCAVTVTTIGFYVWNPKVRNYGGLTQGMRWLFWLFPLWLAALPRALEGERAADGRRLALAALVVSVFSMACALRAPWSHPWLYLG